MADTTTDVLAGAYPGRRSAVADAFAQADVEALGQRLLTIELTARSERFLIA